MPDLRDPVPDAIMFSMETLSQRLARNLDLIRTARKMDVEAFAETTGVTRQVVSLWRNGRRAATLTSVQRAAEGLGMRPSALLEEKPSDVLEEK